MGVQLAAGIAFLASAAAFLALAVALVVRAPRNPVTNAFFFFMTETAILRVTYGLISINRDLEWWPADGAVVGALGRVVITTLGLTPVVWLYFVAAATRAPALAWLRRPVALLVACSVGLVAGTASYLDRVSGSTTGVAVTQAAIVLTAIVVLSTAWVMRGRTEPGSLARRRMNAYFAAFAVYDVTTALMQAGYSVLNFGTPITRDAASAFALVMLAIQVMVFLPLLLYAILAANVMDLDHKFRIGISRTTLAAFFVAAFVAAQTLVSEYFSEAVGLLAGAAAAGALVLVAGPLRRVADAFASKATPGRAAMSREGRATLYREQVQIAYSDGSVGAKERTALRNIRDRLRLSASEALAIEDAVATAA